MNYDNCDGITYTIKQGDTLYGISRKYDVPLAMILHANPYADVYRLNIGDTICIPVKRKCCTKNDASKSRNSNYNMENNISGSINVSGNTTDMSRNVNISENITELERNKDVSDNEKLMGREAVDNMLNDDMSAADNSSDMSFMNDNMDLPDKIQHMPENKRRENAGENNVSDDDNWVKYVAQPGDTLFDVFEKSDCDLDEFLNKNGLKGIYILPGLVYFVKEK